MADLKLVNEGKEGRTEASPVVLCVVKNELDILPAFLDHYRRLGVEHFILLDNNSNDGSLDYLKQQPDVMLYFTTDSYRASFDGILWTNELADRHCTNRWTLVVDADEFLVLPPLAGTLPELTRYLTAHLDMGLYCPMVDFFADSLQGPGQAQYDSFAQLLLDAPLIMPFAPQYLKTVKNHPYHEINIKGGLREYITGKARSPRLNKTPLVYWHPGHRFIKSTHEGTVLPLSFASGVLCHFKYRPGFIKRMEQEFNNADRQDPAEAIFVSSRAKAGELPRELQEQAVHIRQMADLVTAGWLLPKTSAGEQSLVEGESFPVLWRQKNETRQAFFPLVAGMQNDKTANLATLAIAEKFHRRQVGSLSFRLSKRLRIWLYRRGLLPPDLVPELVDHPGGPVESMACIYESFWWAIGAPLRVLSRIYGAICWRKLFGRKQR